MRRSLSIIARNNTFAAVCRYAGVTISLWWMVIYTLLNWPGKPIQIDCIAFKSHLVLTATNTESVVSRLDQRNKVVVTFALSSSRFTVIMVIILT